MSKEILLRYIQWLIKLMVLGVLGEPGDLVQLIVVLVNVPKNESVITHPQRTEEKAVTPMDLVMRNQKTVTAEIALVYKCF